MLLTGDGFDNLGELIRVQLSGQDIPVLDHVVVSNEFMRVLVIIPERAAIGETEISFIFEGMGLDAYFVVEGEEREFSPLVRRITPQEGQVDSELTLTIEGIRLSEFGELGGVLIADLAMPVNDGEIESDQLMFISIYLLPETPPGETEIRLYFENGGFEDFFLVWGPDSVGPGEPFLEWFSPQEGFADTEVELFLEGGGFFELGELLGVDIAGIDIPVVGQARESDEAMVIVVYLPPDLPSGETGIRFYFDDYDFGGPFVILERDQGPEEPRRTNLRGLQPHEGLLDTEIELFLEGENLFELGELLNVSISGIDIPIVGQASISDEALVVQVYLPPDLPTGETRIAFTFENDEYADSFAIRGREPGPVEPGTPNLWGLSPQEGEVDAEVELSLEGENLLGLGGLIGVNIGGMDVRVLSSDIVSNDAVVVRVYLPEDTRRGEQVMTVSFENAGLEEPFFVRAAPASPIPPAVVVVVVVVVVGAGGVLVGRAIRGRRLTEKKPDEKPSRPEAKVEFIVAVDPGRQSVERAGESLTMDINLRFEIAVDPGEQSVQTDGKSLIEGE